MFNTRRERLDELARSVNVEYNKLGMTEKLHIQLGWLVYDIATGLIAATITLVACLAITVTLCLIFKGLASEENIGIALSAVTPESILLVATIIVTIGVVLIAYNVGKLTFSIVNSAIGVHKLEPKAWKCLVPWLPEYVQPKKYNIEVYATDTLAKKLTSIAMHSTLLFYMMWYIVYCAFYILPNMHVRQPLTGLLSSISINTLLICMLLWSIFVVADQALMIRKLYYSIQYYTIARPKEWKTWKIVKWFTR